MHRGCFFLALLVLSPSPEAAWSAATTAPSYTSASIVNSATNLSGAFAPNTIVSIYGSNLSYSTAGLAKGAQVLPRTLGGVTVFLGAIYANLFYVSPTQINLLIPNSLVAGPTTLTVNREGTAGPSVAVILADVSPGIFQLNSSTIIATHADGALISGGNPAKASEVIVIYAVGLGRTVPDAISGEVASRASPIQNIAAFHLLVGGAEVPPLLVLYAGLTPGFAGLYQVNVQLPDKLPDQPEIRIVLGAEASPAGLSLPTVGP